MIGLQAPARLNEGVLRGPLLWLSTGATVFVTVVGILSPSLLRAVLAVLATAIIVVTWLRWPRIGLLLAMAFLPLLALLRRLLIPISGFTSYDPLLLVVPITTVVVLARLYIIDQRPVAPSLFAKLVLGLLVITVAEAFNPESGSLVSGVTGLLFLAAPLAWFFIGREVADQRLIASLLLMLLVLATTIALYGFYQTAVGLPDWDRRWVAINGYAALNVGGTIRAFGTFSSAAEYATYLGMALVVALTLVLKRRFLAAAAVPVLGLALFIESGRGAFVLTLASLVAVLGLSTGRPKVALLLAFLAVSGAFLAERFVGQAVAQSAMASGNPLIAHQVGGLTDPLNGEQSTLAIHVQSVLDGLTLSVRHPFGLGTAFTTLAASGGQVKSTEVDISNAFVSLGWVGGALFVSVGAMSLWHTSRLSLRRRDLTALACSGVLIVTLSQWLNGGFYAVAPMIWLVIGWSSRAGDDLRLARRVAG